MDKSRGKSRKRQKGERYAGRNGGTLVAGAGRGPKPGAPNAGRPPNEWKAKLQAMASRDEVLAHVEAVLLQGPEHPFFKDALNYVTEHGYGRARQPLDVIATITIADAIAQARRRAVER